MSPDQALQILDVVTGLAPINRQDQQNTMTALAVLRKVVNDSKVALGATPLGEEKPADGSDAASENGSEATGEQDGAQSDTNS